MANNSDIPQNSNEVKPHLNMQSLENLASKAVVVLANNASHWPGDSDCEEVVAQIAWIVDSPGFLRAKISPSEEPNFNGQDMADLVNVFSKFSDGSESKKAIVRISQLLPRLLAKDSKRVHQGQYHFNSQNLSDLVTAFSEDSEDEMCKKGAILGIAQFIIDKVWDQNGERPVFNEQELLKLAKSFIAWPDATELHPQLLAADSLQALVRVAADGQELANVVNAFSLAEDTSCQKEMIVKMSQILGINEQKPRKSNLTGFSTQELASVVNALREWPDNSDCKELVAKIAKVINTELGMQRRNQNSATNQHGPVWLRFNAQNLSDLASAFSKGVGDTSGQQILRQIAELVSEVLIAESCGDGNRILLEKYHFNPQNLSDLANAFDKCPDGPYSSSCKGAISRIAQFIIDKTWDQQPGAARPEFNQQESLKLASAISAWPVDRGPHLSREQLRDIVTTNMGALPDAVLHLSRESSL